MARPGSKGATLAKTPSSDLAPAPKKRRSTIACRQCHERRVRCDGSTRGIPCSTCIETGQRETCKFIESKRTRGYAGRFSKAKPKEEHSLLPEHLTENDIADPSAPSSSSAVVVRRSSNNTHEIQLPSGQMWSTLLPFGAKESMVNTGRFTYLGEMWTLSYVVERTNPRNNLSPYPPLHVPIPDSEDESVTMETLSGDLEALRGKGAYELPNDDIQAAFLHVYLRRGYPHYPIVSPSALKEQFARRKVPILLLQAVFFAGATHADDHTMSRSGFPSRREAQAAFFSRAKALYEAGVERDKVVIVQSLFLLHSWWASPTDIVDPLHWLTISIRLAQSVGMHRSTARSPMSAVSRSLWKRIWWCLYARDRQCSSAMGQPMMISDCDCDVELLTPCDFENEDSIEWVAYAQWMVSLAVITTLVVRSRFSPGNESQVRPSDLAEIDIRLGKWKTSLPPALQYNVDDLLLAKPSLPALMIHLLYNTQLLLLHRPRRAQSESASHPNDFSMSTSIRASHTITRIAEEILNDQLVQSCVLHCTSALFAAMTMHVILRETGLLRMCLPAITALETLFPSATWIRQIFTKIVAHQENLASQQRQEDPVDVDRTGQVEVPEARTVSGHDIRGGPSLEDGNRRSLKSSIYDAYHRLPSSLSPGLAHVPQFPASDGAPMGMLATSFKLDHETSVQPTARIPQNPYTDLSSFVEQYLLPDTPFPSVVGHPFVGFENASGRSLSSQVPNVSEVLESDTQKPSPHSGSAPLQWSMPLPWNGAQW